MRKGANRHSVSRVNKLAGKRRRKPIDIASLKELTASMPRQKESARVFMRRMRDQARYWKSMPLLFARRPAVT